MSGEWFRKLGSRTVIIEPTRPLRYGGGPTIPAATDAQREARYIDGLIADALGNGRGNSLREATPIRVAGAQFERSSDDSQPFLRRGNNKTLPQR